MATNDAPLDAKQLETLSELNLVKVRIDALHGLADQLKHERDIVENQEAVVYDLKREKALLQAEEDALMEQVHRVRKDKEQIQSAIVVAVSQRDVLKKKINTDHITQYDELRASVDGLMGKHGIKRLPTSQEIVEEIMSGYLERRRKKWKTEHIYVQIPPEE